MPSFGLKLAIGSLRAKRSGSPDVNPTGVGMIIITGQSNGEGADGLPLLSTTPQTRNYTLLPNLVNQDNPIGAATGLVESATIDPDFSNGCGETIASTMAKLLDTLAPYKLLISSVALGGARYGALKKGTAIYTQSMAMLSAFHAAASGGGLGKPELGVVAICALHGESDNGFEITDYAAKLLEWWTDYNADFATFYAGTGVAQILVPLLACQHATIPFNQPASDTRFQLLEAHKANPGKTICVGPRYHLRHAHATPHISNHSQRQHGLTYAKVMKKVVTDAGTWDPVRPLSVNRSGAVITIVFHVPVAPLVLDRSRVFDPNEFYGFEYYDDATSAAIQSVALVGAATIEITLSGTPTGANKKVRYAWAASPILDNNYAGPITGHRGCLRDSDPTTLLGYESFNWCVHFSENVT